MTTLILMHAQSASERTTVCVTAAVATTKQENMVHLNKVLRNIIHRVANIIFTLTARVPLKAQMTTRYVDQQSGDQWILYPYTLFNAD
ncbi:hypothetical protein SK128_016261 [Halocaridina rubra]|uniref:Uncharacterized protein n=1 Tax=Halocaridina rubra TaxID=373956 RepID=A0AAN9A349_HALRR